MNDLQNAPIFICGDFNEPPNQHVFNYLKTNTIPFQHCFYPYFVSSNNDNQLSQETKNVQTITIDKKNDSSLCTMYTSEFKEVIDFIWYTCDNVELIEVLELPTIGEMKKNCGDSLPSYVRSSDHLCIAGNFVLKCSK